MDLAFSSSSNPAGGTNTMRVWDLTNDLSANPQFNSYTTTVPAFSPAANASQMGSQDLLDNGDCRVMNAFYLNGKLHYVHAMDIGGSWNGIRYGRVDVATMQTQPRTSVTRASRTFPTLPLLLTVRTSQMRQ